MGRGWCLLHYQRWWRTGSTRAPKRRGAERRALIAKGKCYCPRCATTKGLEYFSRDKQAPNGVAIYCRSCLREKGRSYYKKNPLKHKDSNLRSKFGITLSEYNKMAEQQKHLCAICCQPNGSKHLVVDHDHKTNSIRGLLCDSCNLGLGKFKDSPRIIKKALRYLRRVTV